MPPTRFAEGSGSVLQASAEIDVLLDRPIVAPRPTPAMALTALTLARPDGARRASR